MDFAAEMESSAPPRWLTLSGGCGAGKSHLARQTKRFWIEHAGWVRAEGKSGSYRRLRECRFISWRKFVQRQKAGEFRELVDLMDLPLLIVDDIGAEYDPTGFAKGRLDELLDARLGKWTFITTNLSLQEIGEQLDARIASRMKRGGSRFIKTTAPDYNLRVRSAA